ncbi:MAG: glutathione S-transferase [Rhodospirillaceae bacterium]
MITLYRHPLSGHAHRVELFLSLIGQDFERIDIDLLTGAHKTPDFLSLNPAGQVPVLDDNGLILTDSNAILVYLARRYADKSWYPDDAILGAEIQKWLSTAAGDIKTGPCDARLVTVFGAGLDHDKAKATTSALFERLNAHLEARSWLADTNPTLADVAAYTYIAHAPEGGVALTPYPNIQTWLRRVEDLPGFLAMQRTATAEAA